MSVGKMEEALTERTEDKEFEVRLLRALERAPEFAVPETFAARVAAALPAVRPKQRRVGLAQGVGMGAGVVLLAVLWTLAPHASPSFGNLAFDVEMALLVELAAIGMWLVRVER